jgi:hypothetical protein
MKMAEKGVSHVRTEKCAGCISECPNEAIIILGWRQCTEKGNG